jgi:para-nitrobenzyl esterase
MALIKAQTRYGTAVGVRGNNQAISVFKGIPYAAPPVGELRFMPPKKPQSWSGERVCDKFGPISLQDTSGLENPVAGFAKFFHKEFYPVQWPKSEDSLYLNIWTPAKTAGEKLPVMFWIHGGGLAAGYGHEMEFDGEAIAKRGVILVTVNYRLGVVGFFAHPEISKKNPHGSSGNNVFLDQIQALKWVHDNIEQFGGDPGNVTVFGQSGGAGATRTLITSPLTKSLIHRAIIQSGISGIEGGFRMGGDGTAEDWGVKACEVLGMTIDDLYKLPAEDLVPKLLWAEANGAGPMARGGTDGYVLPHGSENAASAGKMADIPIMAGLVSGDVGMFDGRPSNEAEKLEMAIRSKLGNKADAFKENFPISDPANKELYDMLIKGDGTYGTATFGEAQEVNGKKAPYLYFFNPYFPSGDEFNFVGDGTAYHSSELWFMFGTLERCWRSFDGRYYDLSNKMIDYWTNFAKNGDPNGDALPCWHAYDRKTRETMILNENETECKTFENKSWNKVLDFAFRK